MDAGAIRHEFRSTTPLTFQNAVSLTLLAGGAFLFSFDAGEPSRQYSADSLLFPGSRLCAQLSSPLAILHKCSSLLRSYLNNNCRHIPIRFFLSSLQNIWETHKNSIPARCLFSPDTVFLYCDISRL